MKIRTKLFYEVYKYPPEVLKRALLDLAPLIKDGRCYGSSLSQQTKRLRFAEVSHRITEVEILEDGDVMLEVEVLEQTEHGATLKRMLEVQESQCEAGIGAGPEVVFTLTGFGSLAEDGKTVKEDYRIGQIGWKVHVVVDGFDYCT